jgi:SNF2 family DNA or RNA helicase
MRNLAMELRKVCCHPVRGEREESERGRGKKGLVRRRLARGGEEAEAVGRQDGPMKRLASSGEWSPSSPPLTFCPSLPPPCSQFLCNGLEEDIALRRSKALSDGFNERDLLERSSGKMVLLGKLLPKLRAEGKRWGREREKRRGLSEGEWASSEATERSQARLDRGPPLLLLSSRLRCRVLIFSQFKIMLNVIEDYVHTHKWPCERIDGSITGRDRQAAIDRYTNSESGP